MDKAYNPESEAQIYDLWSTSSAFTPKVPKDPKKARIEHEPFTIILPPPNANNPLHAGHALFTVEDIMVRFHRMLGDPTLWLPGTDHAGIETQFVFEKYLQKQGKSRFDYDRETLFKMIFDYVNENRDVAKNQMKRLGFSLDWTREKFTMDPDHIARVYAVFNRMVNEGLVYRGEKIVNYCTHCGTSFSNLEVNYIDETTCLYYMNYGPFVLATTRPETKFGDTAVAVNPKDKRYSKYVGQEITVEGLNGPFKVIVIADDMVDMKFGTGVVKITPAHDPNDFEASLRHHLPIKRVFDFNGRLNALTGKYAGLTINQAREKVVADMKEKGMLVKIDENYQHRIGRCYRCNHVIEPMVSPQWFVKIDSLAKKAADVVTKDEVKIFPKRFKKSFLTWMKDIHDWNISRQIVWGQRIPVWYVLDGNPEFMINFINKDGKIISDYWRELENKYDFNQIKSGLQTLTAPSDVKYYLSEDEAKKNGKFVLQETNTFDTWFSSGQWPYSTLGWDPDGSNSPDFDYFYPTTVLDTGWDILFFWVARMIMMGIYTTDKAPFKVAHMHSRVTDSKGQKMSKSKGNVIDPLTMSDKYGADALRMALVIGVAPGSDISLSEDKIRAQRNFVNKIWNASRFVEMLIDRLNPQKVSLKIDKSKLTSTDSDILLKLNKIITSTTKNLNNYRFGQASEDLYQFFWHEFCDIYIESVKDRQEETIPVLLTVLITSLKLLHPFIPFITETVYQDLIKKYNLPKELLISSSWPIELK
jgi:valyl-tRNA synthetase